jgi:hypothetical protein
MTNGSLMHDYHMQAYAMTEASHQMTSNPLPKYGSHKPGTVGKAQGSVKVRLRQQLLLRSSSRAAG